MVFVVVLTVVGLSLWGVIYARSASLTLTALGVVIVGYVFGHSFWNVHLGPLPLTLDRLLLIVLAGIFAWRWREGRLGDARLGGLEWALGATLLWVTLSALVSHPDDPSVLPDSPIWRLLMSFWTPAFLFFVTRRSRDADRTAQPFLIGFALLGGYLAFTALAETAGFWWAVFPRYIADPELGLHYGRARGPALNSVSLGIHLTVCLWATWLLASRADRWVRIALISATGAMALGVALTYTRSTWLGLAGSGIVVALLQTPKKWRGPLLCGVALMGVLLLPLAWDKVIGLKREDSANVSKHSVQQRTAFAYVSYQMFCDHPLWGVGFGRFYDQKLPYLSDRSQSFELESIRDLHHHNTFLSLLTETGMIGLASYGAVLGGMILVGWRLADSRQVTSDERRLGILLVATVIAYLPSALFHDLSLLQTEQWLLFVVAGVAVGCERRIAAPTNERIASTRHVDPMPCSGVFQA